MTPKTTTQTLKTVVIGALAGAAAFAALGTLKAQSVLTVAQVESDPRVYVGTRVQVTGLAEAVRTKTRRVNGKDVPYVMLDLHKVDAKGRKTPRYIYVALPAADFQTAPVEGQMMAVTGPLKWGYEIAAIDP